MAYIAEEVVVEDYYFDRCAVLHDGAEFLNGHLYAAVAAEKAYGAFRCAHLGSYGGRKSEAHCAESARCHHRTRLGIAEIPCRKHLVLTDIGHHYCIMSGGFRHFIYHLAHVHASRFGIHLTLHHFLIFHLIRAVKSLKPLSVLGVLHFRNKVLQHCAGVAVQRYIHRYIFVELRGVDIDMHNLGIGSVSLHIAGHTVIKSHAYRDEQISLIGIDVRTYVTMHSQHTLIQGMVGRHRGEPQQRRRNRNVGSLGKTRELLLGISYHHAMTRQNHGALSLIDQRSRTVDSLFVDFRNRLIGADVFTFLMRKFSHAHLSILGEIKHYRPGTTA